VSVRVEVVCVNPDGSEQRREVLTIEARELAMETLGLSLSEGKALLAGVQDVIVAQQVYEHLEQRVCVHTAIADIPARIAAAQSSAPYSVVSKCRIRAGTAALARRMGQRHFVR
jgi:hypothetical protein